MCTDESVRGTGLASRLVLAVVAAVRARGDRALLHVAATNANAIRLCEALGFAPRLQIHFVMVSAPPTELS